MVGIYGVVLIWEAWGRAEWLLKVWCSSKILWCDCLSLLAVCFWSKAWPAGAPSSEWETPSSIPPSAPQRLAPAGWPACAPWEFQTRLMGFSDLLWLLGSREGPWHVQLMRGLLPPWVNSLEGLPGHSLTRSRVCLSPRPVLSFTGYAWLTDNSLLQPISSSESSLITQSSGVTQVK